MVEWTGGCACGAIRYTCEGEPSVMLNCHCRDCQRATGSAYAAFVLFTKAAVALKGEPRYHKVIGGSGKPIERGFCQDCGSPVSVRLGAVPGIIGFHAASLDDPAMFKPAMDLFTASAHAWDLMHDYTLKKTAGLAG